MKNRTVSIQTNYVKKIFDDYNFYLKELNAYQELEKILAKKPTTSQGYIITSPKVTYADDSKKIINMTVVPGNSLRDRLAEKSKINWFALGESISILHSNLRKDNIVYGDMSIGNLFICEKTKTTSFIDPGVFFCESAPITQDLFLIMWAINSARFRHYLLILKAECALLMGYFSVLSGVKAQYVENLFSSGAGLDGVKKIIDAS